MNLTTSKRHYLIPEKNIRFEKVEPHGGGKSFKREDHTSHGQYLLKKTTVVKASLALKEDYALSKQIFLNLKSPQKVSIKSEKIKLRALGFEILSLYKSNKNVCLAKISKESFQALEDRIQKYAFEDGNPGKTNISVIEDFEEVHPDEKLILLDNNKQVQTVIIYLYSTLSQKEKFLVLNHLELALQKLNIETESQIFANGATAISCKAAYNNLKKIVSSFSTINKVEKNSMFFVRKSMPTSSLPTSLTVLPPASNSIVAIIDSGIKSSTIPFKDLITNHLRFLPSTSTGIDEDHGSFVASRCLYGDEIDFCLTSKTLMPMCKVMDVTVFGKDKNGKDVGPDDFFLMNILGQVVKRYYKEVKVYNLSLGKPEPINDFEYSEVAKLIDYLSKTYNVIFVIASGNIDQPLGSYPNAHFTHNDSRLGSPAESLLAVTVGSIAKYDDSNCLAIKNELSPFSRIGPGADGGLKPEIVCHGGNLVIGYTFSQRTSTYGINNTGNQIAVDVGTSFAAPIISQYIIRLIDAFPNAKPNLIKGLLFHFAQKRSIPSKILNPHNFYTGFGEPHIEQSIFSAPNTFSYLFEGILDQQQYQFVGFHIPSAFKNNSKTKLKVKITIVFDPSVNPINHLEYSMVRISASLFKAQQVGFKEIQIDAADKYNLPWNPILQFEKEFTRNFLCGYWELRLRLFTRGTITEKYKQNFAVIIEIIDAKSKIDVFRENVIEYGNIYEVSSDEAAA